MLMTKREYEPLAVERIGCLRRMGGRRVDAIRLVCFPWSGAGASAYRFLAGALPAQVELYAVQLPGREERFHEKKLVRMAEVVEHVLPDLLPLADRPLYLFGHSLGALVAYEVALGLRAATGIEPDGLIVSGHGSPHHASSTNRNWHAASDADFTAHIAQLGGTSRAILDNPAMFNMLLPCIRADYELRETYRPVTTAPFSCSLQICAGTQDSLVSAETMGGWLRYSSGSQGLHWFDGDHFYLTAHASALTARLDEWTRPQPASVLET
jgi:surfactin synthase thioesterase subunit